MKIQLVCFSSVLSLMFVSLFASISNAQDEHQTRVFLALSNRGEASFQIYSDSVFVRSTDAPPFSANLPEYTLWLFLKADNLERLKKTFRGDIPEHYGKQQYLNKMLPYRKQSNLYFYQLESRLVFSTSLGTFSIIKFINHNPEFPRPFSSFMHFKKIADQWFISLPEYNSSLGVTLMQLRSDRLAKVFKNERIDVLEIDEFIARANRKSQTTDINFITQQFDDWVNNAEEYEVLREYFIDFDHSPFLKQK